MRVITVEYIQDVHDKGLFLIAFVRNIEEASVRPAEICLGRASKDYQRNLGKFLAW